MIRVLPGHRNAAQALRRQSRDNAARGAIIRRDHRVDLVRVLGENLLHVLLRDIRLPAIGVFVSDDFDVALLDRFIDDLLRAGAQEVRVGVGRRALDEHVVALRHELEHLPRLHAADLDVVERDVEDAWHLDQPIIGDDRNLLADRLVDGGQDRVLVHREHDQRLRALGHQPVDIGELLLGGPARVGTDVLGAEFFELRLDRRLVGLPALFLEVRPGDADDGLGGGRERYGGEDDGDRGVEDSHGWLLSSRSSIAPGDAGTRYWPLGRRPLRSTFRRRIIRQIGVDESSTRATCVEAHSLRARPSPSQPVDPSRSIVAAAQLE